jgi:hypothetical protein
LRGSVIAGASRTTGRSRRAESYQLARLNETVL